MFCQDCNKFQYSFDITLVDEQNQPISGVPYRVVEANSGFEHASGTINSLGKIQLTDMPPKPLRLVLDCDPFLEVMQQPHRYLRTSRQLDDSPIKTQAEQAGSEYQFLKVGQLIDQLPTIDNWPMQDVNNPNWQAKKGKPVPEPALPHYHFPNTLPQGLLLYPRGAAYKHRVITLEVSPFRAWSVVLEHSQDYSLVNAYNLALMSILTYARFNQQGETKNPQGSLQSFFGEALYDLSQLPIDLNDQQFQPIVVDVPFNQRYTQYEFIDTSSESYDEVGDSQLFYVINDKQAIIGWRGTAGFPDVWTDAKGIQADSAPLIEQGKMHLGFKQAFEEQFLVKNNLGKAAFERLNQLIIGKELFITGHSLGGALALIDSVAKQDLKPILYTYGMPRVFNREAIAQINLTHYRHVNENDAITSVPHQDWTTQKLLLTKSLTGSTFLPDTNDDYLHHGHLVHFTPAQGHLFNGQAQGWMDTSANMKDIELKLMIAPDAIGASCHKVFELICQQYDSQELDNPIHKTFNPFAHPSALYADYLRLRVLGKLHAWQQDGQGYETQKAAFLQNLQSNPTANKAALALGRADDLLLEKPFQVDVSDMATQQGLMRFLMEQTNEH